MVGLDGVDLDLYPGEVLAIIGDNGAGKSTLIKALTGALTPDCRAGVPGRQGSTSSTPQDARQAGIETVYQTLAVAPALDIAANLFLGRERRRPGRWARCFRMLDKKGMKEDAGTSMANLGIATVQNMAQAVETLSGGQRQAVAVARAATFAHQVRRAGRAHRGAGRQGDRPGAEPDPQIKAKGLPVILISHNMPNVFEVADRIHIARLGGCAGVITPKSHTPTEAVAIMTGATTCRRADPGEPHPQSSRATAASWSVRRR